MMEEPTTENTETVAAGAAEAAETSMKDELLQAEKYNAIKYDESVKAQTGDDTDIYAWANNLIQYIDDLKIELFLFNKNFTVYKAKVNADVQRQLRPLFVDEIMEYILGGIEKGLMVRKFEDAEAEDGVLQYTKTGNVEKLATVLNWIRNEKHNIEVFDEAEHDLKRMKGVVAHCTHKDMPKSFTIIKNLPSSQIMKGQSAWMLKDGTFKPFDEMTALKIPADNQLMVVDTDLFVFSQARLKQLFGYDMKASSIAAQKVAEIESNFKLSFAEGFGLQSMVKGKPSTIKKLQNIQPSLVKQQDLIDHAEELGLDLMIDDVGAIIITDDRDLVKFVNLLNDDYMESNMTGLRYEIKSKKILKIKISDT